MSDRAVRPDTLRSRAVIWWMQVADVRQAEWAGLSAILDADERARADAFHFDADRHDYVAAHALGRCLLSRYGDAAPRS